MLGGGLSQLAHLYAELPPLLAPHVFSAAAAVDIRPPRWGDSSGVRGAAWLWDAPATGGSGSRACQPGKPGFGT